MNPFQFSPYQAQVTRVLRKNGVKKAALFGSFARGCAKKKSDIDLVIEFRGKKSLFDLVALKQELEECTHRKVDVVTYKSLSPLLKDKIMSEQVTLL